VTLLACSTVARPPSQPGAVASPELSVSLQVSAWRDNPARPIDLQTIACGDAVVVHVKLSRPAYTFLIAFNPDASEQLCPDHPTTRPAQSDRFEYPRNHRYFNVGSDPGLQVFVLVVSCEPLPVYRDWRGKAPAPWPREVASATAHGVWEYNGRWLARVRGQEEDRSSPLSALSALSDFFETRLPKVDVVRMVAFPVKATPRARQENK
jgi:hypothetical protein